jgi:hypothetical protein
VSGFTGTIWKIDFMDMLENGGGVKREVRHDDTRRQGAVWPLKTHTRAN